MTASVAKLTADLAVANSRIADLEKALGLNDDNLGVAFRLSTSLCSLLGCLLSTPNVTPEMITLRLNIATDAKVAIHRLRAVLKDHGIIRPDGTSVIQSRRGLGYWLAPEDKDKINAVTLGVTKVAVVAPSEPEAKAA